jgi:hypothetical protein
LHLAYIQKYEISRLKAIIKRMNGLAMTDIT